MDYFKQLKAISIFGVNGKTAGSFPIGTTENGTEYFHPIFYCCVLNTLSGTLALVPTLNVGTNASAYNNILSSIALNQLTGVNSIMNNMISGSVSRVAANTPILGNITTIAIATTLTFDLHIFGIYN